MTLKRRILSGYAVAFALMAMVVAWAVANIVSLGKASDAILRENYRSILAAENMVDALERQDSGILLVIAGDTQTGPTQFREHDATFLEWLARAKDNITIDGEAELVQSIDTAYSMYRAAVDSLWRTVEEGGSPPVLSAYQESVFPAFSRIRELCIELRDLNEETMYAASVRAGQVSRRAIGSTVGVAVSAAAIALGLSLLISERIVQPVRNLMSASRKIASGDYTVEVPVAGMDELGRLADEFNQMAAQLRRYQEINIEQVISEKQKGEAILGSIEEGLIVLDPDLNVTNINVPARRILGQEFTGASTMRCSEILPNERIQDLIKETVQTGVGPKISDEERMITLGEAENPRHYLFSVTPIRGRGEHVAGIVLLLRDVTRLKEVERIKSEFVMAASHELRTPVTSISMSIDLLCEHAKAELREEHQELLVAAHEEVERLKVLLNDLLDLSKIEVGKIEMEMESVDVGLLIEHAQSIFRGQIEMKSVDLSVELADRLPKILADANKITWVLTNLISNALRYVKAKGHIRILAEKHGEDVHLSVIDDGLGIPQEFQTRIFEKFVQVKGRPSGGTGLGLAICREIVRAHKGTIWVESAPGKGSTFTFTVPVAAHH